MSALMLCSFILQGTLLAQHAANTDQKQIAAIEQLTPDTIGGIRFSFEMNRREEFDQDVWQKICGPVLAYASTLSNTSSNASLYEILAVAKNAYDLAKETDFVDGKMSLTLADSSDLIRSKDTALIKGDHSDPSTIEHITLIFELSRDDEYDVSVWNQVVEIGANSVKKLLLSGAPEENVKTTCAAMERMYALVNGTSWAHETTRIVLQGKEQRTIKLNDEEDDDELSSKESDNEILDDEQTRQILKDDNIDDEYFLESCPCEGTAKKSNLTVNVEAFKDDWDFFGDETHFFDGQCAECGQKL